MYAFDYLRPDSLEAALAALKTEGAMPLGGGQTLTPTLKQRLAQPDLLVDVTGLPELKGVALEGERLVVKAAATHAEVAADAATRSAIPALAALANKIGDPQVRNRGTIGGSVANNDPAACYPAAVLALDGVVTTDRREIAAAAYFTGLYETSLDEGELVTAVSFRRPDAAAWMKFPQPASRFALVGVFLARFGAEARVAITGAGDEGVFRHTGLEAALSARFEADAVNPVTVDADGLMDDIHATPAYRAHLIKVMTKRGVAEILSA